MQKGRLWIAVRHALTLTSLAPLLSCDGTLSIDSAFSTYLPTTCVPSTDSEVIFHPCAPPAECNLDTGKCFVPLCQPNETRCAAVEETGDPTQREACAASRLAFEATTPCPAGTICRQNDRQAECIQTLCSPQEIRCGEDRTSRWRCDDQGLSWQMLDPCDASQYCDQSTCITATTPRGNVYQVPVTEQQAGFSLTPGAYGVAFVHLDPVNTEAVPLTVSFDGNLQPFSIPGASPSPSSAAMTPAVQMVSPPESLQDMLIVRSLTHQLAERFSTMQPISAVSPPLVPPLLAAPVPQEVGATRTFYVLNDKSAGSVARTGVLRAKGTNINLWEDVTAGSVAQASQAVIDELLMRIDTGSFQRNVALFGPTTDVDGNGKVDIFLTDFLTRARGYVWQVNLFPNGTYSVPSDFGEIVYLAKPKEGIETAIPVLSGTAAHEINHLIVIAYLYGPYLGAPTKIPSTITSEYYHWEGWAVMAEALSGQDQKADGGNVVSSGHNHFYWSFSYNNHWSIGWILQNTKYIENNSLNYSNYGFAAIWLTYLFEQSGGAGFVDDVLVRQGGSDFFLKFINTPYPYGLARYAPMDGRTAQQAYIDLAATCLTMSFDRAFLSESLNTDMKYHFKPMVPDSRFHGWVGMPFYYSDLANTPEKTGPVLQRMAWRKDITTIRAGGVSFYELTIGAGGAKLRATDPQLRTVLIRLQTPFLPPPPRQAVLLPYQDL